MGRFKALTILITFFLMVSISWIGQAPSLLAKPSPPMPASRLIHSFEKLLGRQVDLLHSYEELAWPLVCSSGQKPELEVVASFEELLHGQVQLLGSFSALVSRLAMPPGELIESAESLLNDQADLLHGFEGILHCLVEVQRLSPKDLYPFVKSFEELLRAQTELLKSFEALVKGAPVGGVAPSFEPPHHRSMQPPDAPVEAELPSLEAIKDFALHSMEMVQHGNLRGLFPAFADLANRLTMQLERFKQVTQTMRTEGLEGAGRREAQLTQFRSRLMQLQAELLKNSLAVQLEVMADAPDTFHVTVENRGPFTVTLATLLLFEGPRMIYSQSLGTLGPGERRALTIRADARALPEVRGMASGFIDLITKLMAMTMEN